MYELEHMLEHSYNDMLAFNHSVRTDSACLKHKQFCLTSFWKTELANHYWALVIVFR